VEEENIVLSGICTNATRIYSFPTGEITAELVRWSEYENKRMINKKDRKIADREKTSKEIAKDKSRKKLILQRI